MERRQSRLIGIERRHVKVTIDIPDKISHRDTYIASMEADRKGLKARLEKSWRKCLRRYRPLTTLSDVNSARMWVKPGGIVTTVSPTSMG